MTMQTPTICGSPAHALNRRAFLGGVGGLLGGMAGLDALGGALVAGEVKRRHKRVILLWMAGGLSQFESWDPKPGRKTGGPFQAIETSVPGYRMSELMPKMAARIHKTAVIRSFSSPNTGHTGPTVNALMSGDRKDTGNLRTPSLGCLLARELSQPGSALPDHVSLWDATWPFSGGDKQLDFALFLGGRYEPINISSKLSPDGILRPALLSDADHRAREALREQLAGRFQANRSTNESVASHGGSYHQVRGIMDNAGLFDISKEPQEIRERYGHSLFGQQALVARRLVEAGVPFVRVTDGWWDAHGENFEIHASKVPTLDRVMSALLEDLEQRDLLRDTLVVTFAEMGRTPQINAQRGRDHWGACWSVTLTGCGIKPGVIHGSTNEDGTAVATDRVTAAEFFATIFQALGIDHQKEYMSLDGRPIRLTPYNTEPVRSVLA